MKHTLEKLGYIVQEVDTYRSENEYHNKVNFKHYNYLVASKSQKEIDLVAGKHEYEVKKLSAKDLYDRLYKEAQHRLIIKEMLNENR